MPIALLYIFARTVLNEAGTHLLQLDLLCCMQHCMHRCSKPEFPRQSEGTCVLYYAAALGHNSCWIAAVIKDELGCKFENCYWIKTK